MDMFGRVGLVEIPILIAPDQKTWLDRMITEGKIAIPPGGTLERGSLYSMFIRMLLARHCCSKTSAVAREAESRSSSSHWPSLGPMPEV